MGKLIVPLLLIGILLWSLLMQRKAVSRQKQAMDAQAEAMERQKEAMRQVEEGLQLNRRSVENQEKVIALLEQIRDRSVL
jgi:type II secretory pathway pseudopilin PulG